MVVVGFEFLLKVKSGGPLEKKKKKKSTYSFFFLSLKKIRLPKKNLPHFRGHLPRQGVPAAPRRRPCHRRHLAAGRRARLADAARSVQDPGVQHAAGEKKRFFILSFPFLFFGRRKGNERKLLCFARTKESIEGFFALLRFARREETEKVTLLSHLFSNIK